MKRSAYFPYNLELGRQLMEVPSQLYYHRRQCRPLPRAEKYRFGPGWRQYLLLWAPPAGAPARKSVLVLYHGGGWFVGWPGINPTVIDFFLRQGFPVIMPAYRLLPLYRHRHMREDINLALAKTLQILREKGWEDKKVLLSGISAGATLAAHLAFNRGELEQIGASQDCFSGFLSIGGPLDLDCMPQFGAVRGYAGGRPGSDLFKAANPCTWISEQEQLPVLLLHGTIDAIVPIACSESFAARYPGPLRFLPLPGVSHLYTLRFATDDTAAADVILEWLKDK